MPLVEAPFLSNRRLMFNIWRLLITANSIALLSYFTITSSVVCTLSDLFRDIALLSYFTIPFSVVCTYSGLVRNVLFCAFLNSFIALLLLNAILPKPKVYASRKFFLKKMNVERPPDMYFKKNPNSWLTEFINLTGCIFSRRVSNNLTNVSSQREFKYLNMKITLTDLSCSRIEEIDTFTGMRRDLLD